MQDYNNYKSKDIALLWLATQEQLLTDFKQKFLKIQGNFYLLASMMRILLFCNFLYIFSYIFFNIIFIEPQVLPLLILYGSCFGLHLIEQGIKTLIENKKYELVCSLAEMEFLVSPSELEQGNISIMDFLNNNLQAVNLRKAAIQEYSSYNGNFRLFRYEPKNLNIRPPIEQSHQLIFV